MTADIGAEDEFTFTDLDATERALEQQILHESGPHWTAYAQISKADVHAGALRAFADALNTGVSVDITVPRDAPTRMTANPEVADPASDPEMQQVLARFLAHQASQSELEQARDRWQSRQAAKHSAATAAPKVGKVTLSTETIRQALKSLLTISRVPRDVASAADLVIRDLSVQLDIATRTAKFSCYLRLPDNRGAVLLAGPIHWSVNLDPGAGARAVRAKLGAAGLSNGTMLSTVDALMAVGVGRQAAQLAWHAPFKWLVPALLHALDGQRMPDDASAEWTAAPFQQWLAQVYTSDTFTWHGGKHPAYTRHRFAQQMVLYIAAEHGAPVTSKWVVQQSPITLPTTVLSTMTYETYDVRTGTKHPAPLLADIDAAERRKAHPERPLRLLRCPCGAPAMYVCVAPEIPRALLCQNRHMLDSLDHGLPPGIVFPAEYLSLAPTRQECERWLTKKYSLRDNPPIGPTAAAVLAIEELTDQSWLTTREIADAVGRRIEGVRICLQHLATRGRLEKGTFGSEVRWRRIAHPSQQPPVLRSDALRQQPT